MFILYILFIYCSVSLSEVPDFLLIPFFGLQNFFLLEKVFWRQILFISSCVLSPFSCVAHQAPLSWLLHAKILEWIAMPSSRGSSRPGDQTHVSGGSCTADGFFTTEPPGKPKVKVKVAQSCLTHCDTVDSTVHGILQASILDWLPFPSLGGLPNPGIEPRSPTLQSDSSPAETPGEMALFLLYF